MTIPRLPHLAAAICLAVSLHGCASDEAPPTGPAAEPVEDAGSLAPAGRPTGGHVIATRGPVARSLLVRIERLGGVVETAHEEAGLLVVRGLRPRVAQRLARRADVISVAHDVEIEWVPRLETLDRNLGRGLARRGMAGEPADAPLFDRWQWYLKVIHADQTWDETPRGAGALVCVLDTGVDPDHPELAGKVDLAISRSFVPHEPDIFDRHFHGTFVSALVATNAVAMASLAPEARLCAVKVLDSGGSGSFASVIQGIVYAADIGADVANLSLGVHMRTNVLFDANARGLVRALQEAIHYANLKGTLVVAAAGNDGVNLDRDPLFWLHVPSQLAGVVSVSATAPHAQRGFDRLADYSNWGRSGVDVAAPGGNLRVGGRIEDLILSACSRFVCGPGGGYGLASGTSFSAPLVSALAAVVESQKGGDQAGRDLAACIEFTAERFRSVARHPRWGRGRIDALAAARGCGWF